MRNQDRAHRLGNHEYYRLVTFKVGQELDQRLTKAAKQKDTSVSEIIRQCCFMALAADEAAQI